MEHTLGKLRHPLWIVLCHIRHIRRSDDGQSCSVRHVIQGTNLVLHLVSAPVLLAAYAAGAVMRHHSAPHDVGACIIVLGIGHHLAALVDAGHQHTLTHTVAHLRVRGVGEVTLQYVHHHVADAAGRLPGRERKGQLRVHNGELRTQYHGVLDAQLLQRGAVGDYRIARALRTGSRNGEHHTDGKGLRHLCLADVVVPEVALIPRAAGNGLHRVDDAASADGEEKVDILAPYYLDALTHLDVGRVRLNAAQLHVGYTLGIESALHPDEQTAAHGAAATIGYQHARRTIFLCQLTGLRLCIATENELCRRIESEIIHI